LQGQSTTFMLVYDQSDEKGRKELYADIQKKLMSSSSHLFMLLSDFIKKFRKQFFTLK